MPLGTEVGLGPGDIVLDGDPAPPIKGTAPPLFGPCLFWPIGWMDHQDATWYEGRPEPGAYCIRWGPSFLPPQKKGAQQPPSLGPCLLWPNSRPSQLLLSTCLFLFAADVTVTFYSCLSLYLCMHTRQQHKLFIMLCDQCGSVVVKCGRWLSVVEVWVGVCGWACWSPYRQVLAWRCPYSVVTLARWSAWPSPRRCFLLLSMRSVLSVM